MPPVKAPKKAAKKAAKKHTAEHKQERNAKDTRRSYEHLGRVEALSSFIEGDHRATIHELVTMARGALAAKHTKDGADLLRAAEHLSFGLAFKGCAAEPSIHKDLEEAIREEYRHLQEKAAEHTAHNELPAAVQTIFLFMTTESGSAMRSKNYRCALEMGRGAEALAHVTNHPKVLATVGDNKLLT